jgi:hypothetical protein
MSVLGRALERTFFLDAMFSYKSDTSRSDWSWLRVEESSSEMIVRGLDDLLRWYSFVILPSQQMYID